MADAFDPYHKWLGIPRQEQPPHYYRLLGISLFEGDPDVIESAADRQMAHVRTFQNGPHADASQRILNELAAARLCLLDAASRRVYDGELRAKSRPDLPRNHELAEVFRNAVRYAVFEVERLWTLLAGLPAAYHALGEEVAAEGSFRDELAGLYARLDDITDAYRSLHPETYDIRQADDASRSSKSRRPAASPGTAASLVRTFRVWLGAFVYRYRRRAVLRGIGREAFAAHQEASGPDRLTSRIRTRQARLAQLQNAIEELSELPPGQLLNAQRLAWLLGCLLLLPILFLLWML